MTKILLPLTTDQVETLLQLLIKHRHDEDIERVLDRLQYEQQRKEKPYPLNQEQP